ncbi:TolC family protein [Membranicola marinus]|uniref:TolC family protein n=1 Tax=Membranihabitans marinus TaxID=1227546 RepID=A0A953L6C9_9BACT|nr:TolC family protein [Membranihabitans marinus]MBY5957522.1 TolC family protein [Membranihabitans marinus]
MKIYLSIALLWMGSAALSAQSIWTLDRALNHAREHSLLILQARYDIARAEADLRAMQQQRIPSLGFSSNLSNSIGRTIDPTTNTFTTESNYNQSANFNAGVQLFNGGLLHNRIRNAQLGKQVAALEVEATEEDVLLSVVNQFFQALFARENVALASANLELLKSQEERATAEVSAGSKPENELLEIQAELAFSEQQLIEAQNQQDLTELRLKQLLRLPVGEDMVLELPPAEDIQPDQIDLLSMQDLRDRAMAVSPALQSADTRVKSAEVGIQIAQSQYYPSLSLGGSLSTNYSSARRMSINTGTSIMNQTVYLDGNPVTVGFENPSFRFEPIPYGEQLQDNWGLGFGLQLSVPIYSQGSTRASVQQAKINHQTAQIQKEQRVQQFTQELEQTITDLKSSHQSYIASQKTMNASTRFFENIELSYNVGAATSFELINAQNRKEEAETNYLIAKYEYLARKRSLEIYLKQSGQ